MNKSIKPDIEELAKFYEATGDKFFLDKIRHLLDHIIDGTLSELNLKNDFSAQEVLALKFAYGREELTRTEAEDLSGFLLADDGFIKPVKVRLRTDLEISSYLLVLCLTHRQGKFEAKDIEYSFGADSILELKQELLAQDKWLHHGNVVRFIVFVGGTRDLAPVGERVKGCLSVCFVAQIEAAKAWLRDPDTRAKIRDEVRVLQEHHEFQLARDAGTDIGGGIRVVIRVDPPVAEVSERRLEARMVELNHLGFTAE